MVGQMAGRNVCDVCKRREVFFFRPYSGVRLCKPCFVKSIEDKTRATISKYRMFEFDDRIAIGVSGGKDSVTLLMILKALNYNIEAFHIVLGIKKFTQK